ncbi:hypothetical protein L1987_87122 [Smallanthus sonchifolius]|nr:hypothetical protein L1987_87122 [Smallanthus sonchifolius]
MQYRRHVVVDASFTSEDVVVILFCSNQSYYYCYSSKNPKPKSLLMHLFIIWLNKDKGRFWYVLQTM